MKCSECGDEIRSGYRSEAWDWTLCEECMDANVGAGSIRRSALDGFAGGRWDVWAGYGWVESDVRYVDDEVICTVVWTRADVRSALVQLEGEWTEARVDEVVAAMGKRLREACIARGWDVITDSI